MDIISQYILSIIPSITSIIGMIVFIGVGIGRIKAANKDSEKELDKLGKKITELQSKLEDVTVENVLLKKENRKILSKLDHIHFIDKEGE